MSEKTFLVEIGTEELPPKILRIMGESFSKNFISEMNKTGLLYGKVFWFASPRRLSLKVLQLLDTQLEHQIEKRGPPLSVAFDINGNPTKEANNWAKSHGISVDQAEHLITSKGKWLVYRSLVKGKDVRALLPVIVANSLSKLSVSKLMRWGSGDVQFVRPIRTVILLLDDELIPANILGVKSKRVIRGHRFMGKKELTLNHANNYPQLLIKHGKVIADYEVRKSKIKTAIKTAAVKLGGEADIDENLLEEVTSLVEWPVILIAQFEEKFLSIPTEALVYTMKVDQKYFPVYRNGKLLPKFIFVTNIRSINPQQIIIGNERVIRSRLSDAEFFFNTDCTKRLENNLLSLEKVLFHKELGTLREKTDRVQFLSHWIALQIGANPEHSTRAALLSKCDLTTKMVFEFTDMQGIMGMYYALHDGEPKEVAIAIKEQYYPRFFGDYLPSNLVSCCVSIADKIDTIVGIFGVNQFPTGDKDPFALRRAALGILRIIVEKNLPLDLKILTKESIRSYNNKLKNSNLADNIVNFILNRLRTWYQEKGYNIDTIQSVMACNLTSPVDFNARVEAISYLRTLENFNKLVIANKRISNVLAKSTEKFNEYIEESLLKERSEIHLAKFVNILYNELLPYFTESRYQDALIELIKLCDFIDDFFENVMIYTDNKSIRINRLTLLFKIRKLFLNIADISLLIL